MYQDAVDLPPGSIVAPSHVDIQTDPLPQWLAGYGIRRSRDIYRQGDVVVETNVPGLDYLVAADQLFPEHPHWKAVEESARTRPRRVFAYAHNSGEPVYALMDVHQNGRTNVTLHPFIELP